MILILIVWPFDVADRKIHKAVGHAARYLVSVPFSRQSMTIRKAKRLQRLPQSYVSFALVSTLLTPNVGWSTERSPVDLTKEVVPRALCSSKNVENRYAAVGAKLRRR
jgi:hypothetical protein